MTVTPRGSIGNINLGLNDDDDNDDDDDDVCICFRTRLITIFTQMVCVSYQMLIDISHAKTFVCLCSLFFILRSIHESPSSLCQERSHDVGGPSEAAGWGIDTTLHRSALQGAHQHQGAQQSLGALQHQGVSGNNTKVIN